jgi:hypothetical protein
MSNSRIAVMVLLAVLLGIGALLAGQMPEIKRYMKMKRM